MRVRERERERDCRLIAYFALIIEFYLSLGNLCVPSIVSFNLTNATLRLTGSLNRKTFGNCFNLIKIQFRFTFRDCVTFAVLLCRKLQQKWRVQHIKSMLPSFISSMIKYKNINVTSKIQSKIKRSKEIQFSTYSDLASFSFIFHPLKMTSYSSCIWLIFQ